MLNKNEMRVLEIIERDPFISQQNIADELELTRSTVATVISSLTQKKQLLGRAYVVNRSSEVYCIGAMNVDRKFNLMGDMVLQTSNPATSSVNVGGVARNIAENLGRLQSSVSLISLGGHDQDYHFIKRVTEPFVNMQHTLQLNGYATGTYNAIIDHEGEMQMAIADMQINDEMGVEWIAGYQSLLQNARLLVMDLNLPSETVEYVLAIANKFNVPVFIIPVSGPKMNRLPQDLSAVTWLVVNQGESETYFDVTVETEEDYQQLVDRWIEVGVENVVITRGSKGSIYGNAEGDRQLFMPPAVDQVVDVTGAGDAYAAGIIYGHLQGKTPVESIHLGMANSYHTIQVFDTVRTDLTVDNLIKESKLLFKKGKNINESISID